MDKNYYSYNNDVVKIKKSELMAMNLSHVAFNQEKLCKKKHHKRMF